MKEKPTFSRNSVLMVVFRLLVAFGCSVAAYAIIGDYPNAWAAAVLYVICGWFVGVTFNDIFRA